MTGTDVLKLSVFLMAAALPLSASAEDMGKDSPQPGIVIEGSGNTSIGGAPAARLGDRTTNGALAEGSSNVFINGKPAVTTGNRTNCGGIVVGGGSNVFINGKPIARQGDITTGCAEK